MKLNLWYKSAILSSQILGVIFIEISYIRLYLTPNMTAESKFTALSFLITELRYSNAVLNFIFKMAALLIVS